MEVDLAGVSTSGCLLPTPPSVHAFALDLAICHNGQEAKSNPASLQKLIQAEKDVGFAREFPFLEAAQAHFGADHMAVCLSPKDKREKAIALLEASFSAATFQEASGQGLGVDAVVLQCAPELRPWLCCLYDDMRRALGTSYSVAPQTGLPSCSPL